MRLAFTPHFRRSYRKAPAGIRQLFNKMSLMLLDDLGHPSLCAKKYDESLDLGRARVNRDWRFYFTIDGDEYRMQGIKAHAKLVLALCVPRHIHQQREDRNRD